MATTQQRLVRYTSRFGAEWPADRPWREFQGTLVYVDVSGFTALSEKLARRGRIGAEELTDVLNHVFSQMLAVAYSRGGSLLKFGGDALLLVFSDRDDHAAQACSAAVEMQDVLRDARDYRTSAGRLRLRMSVGIHSGLVHLFRVGESHQELIVTGPAASETTDMEETAVAGQILVSSATRADLPRDSATQAVGRGWLLKWRKARVPTIGAVPRSPQTAEALRQNIPVALREHLTGENVEPEHHIATVAFVRFTGMDALMADGGPSAGAAALDDLIRIVQHHVDREGVTFLASDVDRDGGKLILVAGVPLVQSDDGGRVLRASRSIVDDTAGLDLDVRIGVHQGHVFVGEIGTDSRATYTVMGDTVNLAARLMASASAGQVYASPTVLGAAATLYETTALKPFHVKGKEHPVQAYELHAARGIRPAERSVDLPFTGRAAELDRLRSALNALAHGTGWAATIVGERGLGKGRLVDEALESAPEDVLRIPIRGESYGEATPYRALRDPMRAMFGLSETPREQLPEALRATVAARWPDAMALLPLLADVTMIPVPSTPEVDVIDPEFRVPRTTALLTDLLARSFDGAVVFHIEDAQFLDEASAHGLQRVAEMTASHPWMVIATSTDVTEGLAPVGTEIHLDRLTVDEARDLVIAATQTTPLRQHTIDALVDRAAGLPLFVEELLRGLRRSGDAASLPDSLEAAVSAEIDALPQLTRRILQFCSILGTSFSISRINQLIAPENIRLDRATERNLQQFLDRDGSDRLRFRQSMTRDVAYGGLSFKRRRELHARAAAIFEAEPGGTDRVADLLALHHSLTGNHAATWRFARIAGDQAADTYANIDASTHYERALAAAKRLPAVSDRARAEVWADLAVVRERAGLFDEALEALRIASRLVAGDTEVEIDLTLQRAALRRRSEGGYRQALRELTAASRRVEDDQTADGRRIRARIHLERAFVRRRQQRPTEALSAATAAEEIARDLGDLEVVGRALDIAYWAQLMTGRTDIEAPYVEALRIFEQIGDLRSIAEVLNNLGADAYYAGRWTDAIDAYRRSRDADLRTGNEVSAAIAASNMAELAISQGRLDEAAPILEDAIRVLTASNHQSALMFARSELARLLLRRGDLDEAADLIDAIKQQTQAADEAMALLTTLVLEAELELRREHPDDAMRVIESIDRDAGEMSEIFAPTLGRLRGWAHALQGEYETALMAYETALTVARERALPYDIVLLLHAKGELLRATGDTLDAAQRAEIDELVDRLGLSQSAIA